jgi:outer membrane protein TolC
MTRFQSLAICALLSSSAAAAHAQVSLSTAVNLALKNSPKVRMAKADLDKARAGHSESRDAYIPVVSTTTGYGQSTGAPLGVPIIFSISAQSLLFSFSQKDYIRSTNEAVKAAELSLHNSEVEVVEDTTNTYLALDYAAERSRVLQQSLGYADKLVDVTTDRISLGVDPKVELPKSRRTATQIRLQQLQVQDDIAANRQHLAELTGLPAVSLTTDRSSIPAYQAKPSTTTENPDSVADSDGIKAAFANARSKQYVAFGDQRYLLRPQIVLAANYSRVAIGLSSYASYYPRFGGTPDNPNSENSFSFGLQFNIPLLDMGHRAKARGSAADAAKAFADADLQRAIYREGRAKLQNASRELDLRAQLAHDDREIAEDQLETLKLQLNQQGGNGQGPQITPKDQLNAELQERQKYLDVLTAELQLRQTQTNLMRQTNTLGDWILSSVTGSQSLTPSIPPAAGNNTPGVPGTAPTGASTTPLPQAPGR